MCKILRQFLRLESASGILLFFAALIAICLANSRLAFVHQIFIDHSLFLINEGLMSLFFLSIGLELKRHYFEGNLTSAAVILPGVGAFGGMLIPALIYILINYSNPETLKGFTTPVATDIAFAIGVLSLLRGVPLQLKLFLLVLAIFDDMGAILIIAFFYSQGLSFLFLSLSLILLLILFLLNYNGIRFLVLYLLIGISLWVTCFKSGVHPTIAGVLLAFFIPFNPALKNQSPLIILEKRLHPWVAFLIMPLFALVNTGFSLQILTLQNLKESVFLGVVAGLFLGKQMGIFSFCWLMVKKKRAKLPNTITWLQLYGVALLCGIGFTMSLFLGTLSFQNEITYLVEVRLGVIIGSILSGLCGAFTLVIALKNKVSGTGVVLDKY